MKIRYSPRATSDLDAIHEYLQTSQGAANVMAAIFAAVEFARRHPEAAPAVTSIPNVRGTSCTVTDSKFSTECCPQKTWSKSYMSATHRDGPGWAKRSDIMRVLRRSDRRLSQALGVLPSPSRGPHAVSGVGWLWGGVGGGGHGMHTSCCGSTLRAHPHEFDVGKMTTELTRSPRLSPIGNIASNDSRPERRHAHYHTRAAAPFLVELLDLAAGAEDGDVSARARRLSDRHHCDAAGSPHPAQRMGRSAMG